MENKILKASITETYWGYLYKSLLDSRSIENYAAIIIQNSKHMRTEKASTKEKQNCSIDTIGSETAS